MKSSIELSSHAYPGSTATQIATPLDPGQASTSAFEGPAADLEVALEEVRYRTETRTALLAETLDRLDRFPQRFWGINE
jgi:hypothetical protein